MKHLSPLILILILASCTHKDGMLDHSQRLTAVYASQEMLMDGTPYYSNPRHKVQEWFWDGKEVYRIDYREEFSTYSENIFYDGRHRIIQTTIPAKHLTANYSYDGREIASVHVLRDEDTVYTLQFTHEDGHVATITQTLFSADAKGSDILSPMRLLMSNEIADAMTALGLTGKHSGSTIVYHLTWADDNVTRIDAESSEGKNTMEMSYDDKRNPIRDLFTMYEMQDDEPGALNQTDSEINLLMLSRNNVSSLKRPFDHKTDYRFDYQYTYEGKYPVTRTLVYDYASMNDTTFKPCTIQVKEVREYEYK